MRGDAARGGCLAHFGILRHGQVLAQFVVAETVGHEAGFTVQLDLATFQPQRGLAEALDLLERMRHEQDGGAACTDLFDARKAFHLEADVTHRQCFVDDQHIRFGVDGHRERQAHVHAAGIGLDRPVEEIADIGEVDDRLQLVVHFLAAQAQQRGAQVHVVAAGEIRIETGPQF